MSWVKIAIFVAVVIAIPLSCSAACRSISASYMTGYVPEKFGLTQYYSEGACVDNVLAYMGAFAVGLDAQTIQEIEEQGIRYFDDVGGPRSRGLGVRFSDWKETPADASVLLPEAPNNFHCGTNKSHSWPVGFREALKAPGSFYSDGLQGRSAVVIPSLGIIAISMQTR